MGNFIALIPPFLDSIAVYVDKLILSKYNINVTILTLYSGIFAFVIGLIVLLFTGLYVVDQKSTLILVASGFFGIFSLFTYFKALTHDEGSRVGSLFQFIPVIVLVLSFIFFGEKLQLKQYIGSALIILAGFFLALQKTDRGIVKLNKAFWLMILSSLFSAFVYVLFKFGVKQAGFWGSLPYEGFGSGLGTISILMYRNNFKMAIKYTKKHMSQKILIYMTAVEFLARVSRYVLFFALTLIPASIASVLMGFQPFFLLIIGIILSLWFPNLMKEVVTKKTVGLKILATIGIFTGLYLIFL